MVKKFHEHVILITGAAGTLGQAVAKSVGRQRAHLILLDKNLNQLEKLDDYLHQHDVPTTLVACDLADLEKLDMLAVGLAERFKRLNGWVACAAEFSALQPLLHLPVNQWQKELTVNATANLKLLQILMPLLQQVPAGRVVFTVDATVAEPQAYWGSYAISQQILISMAKLYAEENPHSTVKINLFDSGPFASPLRSKAYPGENVEALPKVEVIADEVVEFLTSEF